MTSSAAGIDASPRDAIVTSSAGVAAAVVRLGLHSAFDAVRRERPRNLASIPHSIDMITVEWLSAALCREHPGAKVEGFERDRATRGSTSREALRVRYNDLGRAAGMPERIFAKATPRFQSRVLCVLAGALASEVSFYRHVRGELDIEAPPGLFGAYDPRTGRSMLLFEDIATTRGCTFLDTTQRITQAHAQDMVSLLARLHARYWDSPRLEDFWWLRSSGAYLADIQRLIAFDKRSMIGFERGLSVIPDALKARRDEVWPATLRSLELNSRRPQVYLHHDVHIGNWYRTGEGRMGLTDWQCNVKGQWGSDVAYALSSALDIEDRRAWERDLIRLYVDRLAAAGGPRLNVDDAWLQYRQQLFHGFVFWLFTLGHGPLQPQMQPDSFSLTNIARMSAAIVDLEAIESLG